MSPIHSIHVLVVDDELDLCELTRSFLEASEDMEVDTVCSVAEARIALGQNHYDVIVSDYQMPIEDGVQFLKSLRGRGDSVPFILFTGKGREEVVIEALNNGADSYLQKGGKPAPQYAELEHRIRAVAQKHRSEEALLESESSLQRAEKVAGLGHWRLDVRTQIISGSEEAIAICGLDKRSMAYSEFRNVIVSDYIPLLNKSIKELIEEGKPYDVEAKIRRKGDGKIIDVHSIAEYDREKKVVFGTLQDITRRKRAEETTANRESSLRGEAEEELRRSPKFSPELEEQGTMRSTHELQVHQVELEMQAQELHRAQMELEESRDMYVDLYEFAPLGYLTLSDKGLVKKANLTSAALLGIDRNKLVGARFRKFVAEEENDKWYLYFRNVLEHREKQTCTLTLARSDGATFPARLESVWGVDDSQGRSAVRIAIVDITDIRQVEKALRESEAKFRSLFENMMDGMAYCKMHFNEDGTPVDFTYLDVNRAFGPLTGLWDVVGKNVTDVIPGIRETSPELLAIYGRVALTGTAETFEIYLETLRMWLNISVYSPQKEYIVALFENITRRKAMEDELRSSQRSMADILEFLPDATFAIDTQGKVIVWNRAIEEMTGVKKEDMLGQADHAFSIPFYGERRGMLLDLLTVDDDALFEKYTDVNRDGDALQAETFCSALNGGEGMHVWATATSLYNDQGDRIGSIESVRDITERKRVQNELKQSQHLLSRILDTTPNLIYIYDLKQQRNLYSNREVTEFLGYSPQQIQEMGANLFDIIMHPEDRKAVTEQQEQLRRATEGEIALVEYRLRGADGSWHWVRSRDVIFERASDGSILSELGIAEDITERKRAEEELKGQEQYLRAILQTTADGFWIVDSEGKIADVNDAYCRMLGYTRAELLELHIPDIDAALTLDEQAAAIKKIITNGSGIFETKHRRKDGTTLEVELSVTYQEKNGGSLLCFCRDITERKRAEAEVRRLNSELQVIFDNTPAMIWYKDTKNNFVRVNQAAAVSMGLAPDRIEGRNASEIFPQYSEGYYRDDLEVISKGLPKLGIEENLNTGGGETRWVLTDKIPLRDDAGEVNGILVISQDITERKRIEEAMRESEEKYRRVVETAIEGIIFLDTEARMTFINPQMASMLGHTVEEMLGQKFESFLAEDELGDHRGQMEIRAQGKDAVYERCFRRKDGGEHWALISARAVMSPEGRFKGSFAMLTDITERKRAEEELRRTNTYLNNLLDYANAPILVWDAQLRITIFNHAFERLTGMNAEKVCGQHLHILFPEESRERSLAVVQWTSAGQRWEVVEIPIRALDGGVRTVLWNSASLTNPEGEIIATIAQGQDITERKQTEEALREASRKLNLLSSITRHDITNQLLVLQGHLALLGRERLLPSPNAHLQKAEVAAQQVSAMIQFTKEYQDIGVKAPTWTSPGRQTAEAFTMLHPVGVDLQDDTKGVEVLADHLAEKVPYNLIDNSMRHGEHVTLIKMSAEQKDDAMLIVYEDDGAGVSDEDKKRLFEKGFGKNTGFGLFLCREILAITGITITETGKAGEGVRFEMLVPAGAWRLAPPP